MSDTNDLIIAEYYNRAFLLFHESYSKTALSKEIIHPFRGRFWRQAIRGKYTWPESAELLKSYLGAVEREMATTLKQHSIAYWTHIYRRLSPGAIGDDERPISVGHTRAAFEAAIQKYALPVMCSGVAPSKEVDISNVLGGLLSPTTSRLSVTS